MPELSESFLIRQTAPALLAAAGSSPHAAETLDSDPSSPWRQWGSEGAIVTDTQRATAMAAAEKLFYSSPLAHHIIEQYTDFVVGEGGFELTSSNREAREVLYDFWHSPVNSIPRNLYYQIMEFFVYGEMCYIKKDHPDGFVALTFVPPREISDVIPKEGVPGRPARVILSNEDEYDVIDWDPVKEALVGDCFYFRMQHLGSDVRGYSRLLPFVDFLRVWETFIYNHLAKKASWDSIWWEVTLQGYTQDQIDEWLKSAKSNPPDAGSVFAHNELVDWALIQTDIGANPSGFSLDSNWYKGFFNETSGIGTPESRYIREGGEVLDPITRGLSTRQWEVRTCFAHIGMYVLQQAMEKGELLEDTYDVICQAPRLGVRDFQRSAGALLRFVDALGQAEDRNWLPSTASAGIFQDMLTRLGMIDKMKPLLVPEEEEEEEEEVMGNEFGDEVGGEVGDESKDESEDGGDYAAQPDAIAKGKQ